ncbi:TasA family protein [Fictibacillus barbaricus]|uniref:Spore coat-associated protein N n=1 Tax=Fictibacillus barbaricus TaxID=182136 RepID=A0ABU1U1I9_9BACL|nr:TasA family protein [Fictibacillus barbaricus]MDR7073339.1 spore coat-associated protein N [Fictibacillus barbaricus]
MNKAKKALLGTALAGAMVVSAGFGTYSWFTDVKEANGTIQNGTLTVGMDSNLFAHQNFAPSQMLISNWKTIQNTGSLDQQLRATYTHSIDKEAGIGKYKVGYMAIKYSVKPDAGTEAAFKEKFQRGFDKGITNPVMDQGLVAAKSKYEVVSGTISAEEAQGLAKAASMSKTLNFGKGKFWQLNEGENIDILFAVKLLDTAGNEYQGANYSATFKVEAKQTDNGAEFETENVK